MLVMDGEITATAIKIFVETNTITTRNSKMLCVPMHSHYDMGVAMIDCVIVIVYTLHVWGPLEVQLFIVHWVIKRRQQRQFALEI